MRLTYQCLQCGARNTFTMLKEFSDSFSHEDILKMYREGDSRVTPWVRHPCKPNVTGIAILAGIED